MPSRPGSQKRPVHDLLEILLFFGFVALLWRLWPCIRTPVPSFPARALPARPFLSYQGEREVSSFLRGGQLLKSGASLSVDDNAIGLPNAVALPLPDLLGLARLAVQDSVPELTPLPSSAPGYSPPLPDYRRPAALALPLPAPPRLKDVRPDGLQWEFHSHDGLALDEDALRACSLEARPSGEFSADLLFGDDGTPTLVLFHDDRPSIPDDARSAFERLLRQSRLAETNAPRSTSLRWRWSSPGK